MRHFSLFDSLTLNIIFRLRFTVQGGEAWILTKKDISSSISKLGVKVLDVNFTSSYKTTGLLLFDDKDAAKRVDNAVVEVKGCLVHAHVDMHDLSPFPSDHQILIVLQCLMISLEKLIMEKIIQPKSKIIASAAIPFPVRQIHEHNSH